MLGCLEGFSRRAAAILLLAVAPGATSAAAPPESTGIAWIDWAAEQVSFALEEAAPAGAPAPQRPAMAEEGASSPPSATHSIESIEIGRLREEIRHLRDLIEQGVIGRVIALENEVRTLRGALQQQQIAAYGGGRVVPQPGSPAGAQTGTPMPAEDGAMAEPPPAPVEAAPPEPFEFTVVDEWGRSPEVVAELGGDASTLIGVAGVVPPRSAKEDVAGLAQQLRAEYDGYDNINIEIFDTPQAARAYAERQFVDAEHHVASISRHKASGRDVILYLDSGKAESIPLSVE